MAKSFKDIIKNPAKLNEVAQVVFDNIDTKGKGYISVKDLDYLIIKYAEDLNMTNPTIDELEDLFFEFTNNKTGRIYLNDFIPFLVKIMNKMLQRDK